MVRGQGIFPLTILSLNVLNSKRSSSGAPLLSRWFNVPVAYCYLPRFKWNVRISQGEKSGGFLMTFQGGSCYV